MYQERIDKISRHQARRITTERGKGRGRRRSLVPRQKAGGRAGEMGKAMSSFFLGLGGPKRSLHTHPKDRARTPSYSRVTLLGEAGVVLGSHTRPAPFHQWTN